MSVRSRSSSRVSEPDSPSSPGGTRTTFKDFIDSARTESARVAAEYGMDDVFDPTATNTAFENDMAAYNETGKGVERLSAINDTILAKLREVQDDYRDIQDRLKRMFETPGASFQELVDTMSQICIQMPSIDSALATKLPETVKQYALSVLERHNAESNILEDPVDVRSKVKALEDIVKDKDKALKERDAQNEALRARIEALEQRLGMQPGDSQQLIPSPYQQAVAQIDPDLCFEWQGYCFVPNGQQSLKVIIPDGIVLEFGPTEFSIRMGLLGWYVGFEVDGGRKEVFWNVKVEEEADRFCRLFDLYTRHAKEAF